MFDLSELVTKVNPRQTALLFGAGASIPSGAPSGRDLSRSLAAKIPGFSGVDSYSLSEICSIFEQRLGRQQLASEVATILKSLAPTGGLQLLPKFDWYRIYSTNFDQLIEKVYSAAGRDLLVRRSNYDFSRAPATDTLEYYKIHGCISEDVGFGHKSRMLLTEDDYDNYAEFREAAFRALSADILTKDFLIVGQSLVDPHLKDLIRDALKIKASHGTPGRVFVLAFERDEERARLHEARGAEVFFGDLDTMLGQLLDALPEDETRQEESGGGSFIPTLLPSELMSSTTDAGHAMQLNPDPRALFNGSPGKYADVVAGYTFHRSEHERVASSLNERPIAVILGAGGVGKTTLARQILVDVGQGTDAVWEHNNSFALEASYWIEYEGRLRHEGKRAVLLIDDCVDHLAQTSQIADHLGATQNPALLLILTANTGQWRQRSKSRYVFSHGQAFTLSRLTDQDIEGLINLTSSKQAIRELVEPRFLSLPRGEQSRVLRERCSADMYVCMKNIFASEELDYILLREFGDLDEPAQDIYRHVAALEALGARVHRQLIMRLLSVEAGGLAAILSQLTGIITEFDIRPRDGLFGWETRHRVIASTIAKYKYSQQQELDHLFERLIDSINPSVRLEVDTARALCTEEFGIDRLSDTTRQVELLRKVVSLLPGESIPRHRLIRHLIDQDRLDEASHELRRALDEIRPNPVLARYEVLLLIRKSDLTPGLMDEDRIAILLDAEAKADLVISKYPDDMHGYRIAGDVAIKLAQRGAGISSLESVVARTQQAEKTILDPALADARRRMESELRRARSG